MPSNSDSPQTPAMEQQARDRLRRRLAVVVDDRWPERVRLAAGRAGQARRAPRPRGGGGVGGRGAGGGRARARPGGPSEPGPSALAE